MSSPCYGCEFLTMQKMGWTPGSPIGPFCNGYETPLKKSPDGEPVQFLACDKRGEGAGDECHD